MRKTDLDQFRISHVVNKKASERAHGIDSAFPLCTGSASGPAEIGLDDNFFHLGSDSISAMHLAPQHGLKASR
jgi:hypothetical protein